MPTTLQDNDVLLIRPLWVCGTQIGLNMLHYRVTSTTGAGVTDEQAAAEWDDLCAPAYKAICTSQATYRGVDVRRIAPTLTAPLTWTVSLGAGGVAADAMSRQTCGIITKRSLLAGRANRGRIYLSFPAETSNDSTGSPNGTYLVGAQALADLVCGDIAVISLAPAGTAILRPIIRHVLLGTNTDIADGLARNKWATQKSRGDYGIPNTPPF